MDTLEVIKYLEFGSKIIGNSTKVTPEIAADVLLLADRHCLGGLKQVIRKFVFLQKPTSMFQLNLICCCSLGWLKQVVTEKNIFFFRNLHQYFNSICYAVVHSVDLSRQKEKNI